MEQSLTITFSGRPLQSGAAVEDWLKLEQEQWPESTGTNFTSWLSDNGIVPTLFNVFDLAQQYRSVCSGEDGSFSTSLFVKTSRPDLPYTITTTWGKLSEKTITISEIDKSYTLKEITDTLDVGVRIKTLLSAAWEGNVYDEAGQITPPPKVVLVDGVVSWDKKVYGTLRAKYQAEIDTYTLTVFPREDVEDVEAAYDSTVTVIWGGKLEVLEIEKPPLIGNCEGGASSTISDVGDGSGDDSGDGAGGCYKRIIEIGLCDGKKKSDKVVKTSCG